MPANAFFFSRRRVMAVLLLLVLLGAVLFGWRSCTGSKEAAPQLAEVTTGTVEQTVSSQGKLEPRNYVDVGAQVSGQLDKLHVQAGDTVSASQLVAEIDPRVYESRLKQADATIKSLKAQQAEQQSALNLAKQEHARNEVMVQSLAISKQEFDISAAAVRAAQARVQSVAAQLEQAISAQDEERTNLGYTKIYAPMGGTVVSTSVKEGQTINSSQQAPTILQIADLSTMTVRAQVAEADVGRVKEGLPVTFTTLGGNRPWKGTVRQVLPGPETVNDVVLYNVLVDVTNEDGTLMSGMSTQMTFVLEQVRNVLTIPASAVGAKQSGANVPESTYRVTVMQGNKPVEKQVQLGLQNRTLAEVKSGLNAGDKVVLRAPVASGNSGGNRMRNMGPRL